MPTTEQLIDYIRREYHLLIAELAAETIIEHLLECDQVLVRGRDIVSGLPKTICVPAKELTLLSDDSK